MEKLNKESKLKTAIIPVKCITDISKGTGDSLTQYHSTQGANASGTLQEARSMEPSF